MTFSTDDIMMMALNSFGPQFNPESIPSYGDWLAKHTFNPFGPEPFNPVPDTRPGIPLHFKSGDEFWVDESVDMGNRINHGYGSSEDATRSFSQERSRFAFAQKRIRQNVDISASRIPGAYSRHPPVDREQAPALTKVAFPTVPRVVGPRPLQPHRGSFARREPTLASPRATYPLPTWLTHFENYEDELLAEFRPLLEDSPPPVPSPPVVGPELPLEYVPFDTPLLGFTDRESTAQGWESEDSEEEAGYNRFEFDVHSDVGSGYMPLGSESSALASYWAETAAFCWPDPYQGHQGERYSCANAVTHRYTPLAGSPSLPPPSPYIPPLNGRGEVMTEPLDTLPWSVFTGLSSGTPITASPLQSSASSVIMYDAHLSLEEMEDGMGYRSWPSSRGEVEGMCDWFDLTGYSFPVSLRRLQSLSAVSELKAPPPMYPGTISLPYPEEYEDEELDAVVISQRSPAFS